MDESSPPPLIGGENEDHQNQRPPSPAPQIDDEKVNNINVYMSIDDDDDKQQQQLKGSSAAGGGRSRTPVVPAVVPPLQELYNQIDTRSQGREFHDFEHYYRQKIQGMPQKDCHNMCNNDDDYLMFQTPPTMHTVQSDSSLLRGKLDEAISVKIADLGNACWIDHHFTGSFIIRDNSLSLHFKLHKHEHVNIDMSYKCGIMW